MLKDKKQEVKKEVESFISSEQTVNDFMRLFYVITYATRFGDGLIWPQVEEAVNEALMNKTKSDKGDNYEI